MLHKYTNAQLIVSRNFFYIASPLNILLNCVGFIFFQRLHLWQAVKIFNCCLSLGNDHEPSVTPVLLWTAGGSHALSNEQVPSQAQVSLTNSSMQKGLCGSIAWVVLDVKRCLGGVYSSQKRVFLWEREFHCSDVTECLRSHRLCRRWS